MKNIAKSSKDMKNIVTCKAVGFPLPLSHLFYLKSSADVGHVQCHYRLIPFLQRVKVVLFSPSYMLPTV